MDAILAQAHAALLCVICKGELKRPASIPCGHNFCEACIILSLESHGNTCPECKQPCWRNDVIRNQMLENLVSRLHDTQPLATQLSKGRSSQSVAASVPRPASQTPRRALRQTKVPTAPPQSAGKLNHRSETSSSGLERHELNEESHKEKRVQGGRRPFLARSLVVDQTPEKVAPLKEPLNTQEELKLEATVAAQERELRQIDEQLIAMGVDPETRLSQLEIESQESPSAPPCSGPNRAGPGSRATDEGHMPQHIEAKGPPEAQKEGFLEDNVAEEEATEKGERGRAEKAGVLAAQERGLQSDVKSDVMEESRQKAGPHEGSDGLREDESKHRLVEVSERPKKQRRRPVDGSDRRGSKRTVDKDRRQDDITKGREKMERGRTASDADIDPFAFRGSREKMLGKENDAVQTEGASPEGQGRQKKRKASKVGLTPDDKKREGGLKSTVVGRKSKAAREESPEQKEGADASEPSFLDSPVVEESPQVAYKRRKRKDVGTAARDTRGEKAAHKRAARHLRDKCDAGAEVAGLGGADRLQLTKEKQSGKKKPKSQGPESLERLKAAAVQQDGSPLIQTDEQRMMQAGERASEGVVQSDSKRPKEKLLLSIGGLSKPAEKGKEEVDQVIAETPEKDDFDDWGLGLEEDELDETGLVKPVTGRKTPLQERLEAAAPQKTGPVKSPTKRANEGDQEKAGVHETGQLAEETRERKKGQGKAYGRAVKCRGAKREPLREVSNARTKKLRSPDSEASFKKDLREAIARSLSNC